MSEQHDNPQCPKCNGTMDEGFAADQGYGTIHASQWVEGAPERSFWYGTKIYNKQRYRIVTFRCADCGYLESYAWEGA